MFLTEAPQDPTSRPQAASPEVGEAELEAKGRAGPHLPFPLGQTRDVRTSPEKHKSRLGPVLSSLFRSHAGCAEWGAGAFRGVVGLWESLRRQVVLRVSLKMPPNPTLLQDNDPKEIWDCDQDWEGPTEVKCGGREGCVVPRG